MLRILEFDYASAVHIDQVVMQAMLGRLVTGSSAAEIPPLEDALLFKDPHRAIDGGDRNTAVDGGCAPIEFFDIRMIIGFSTAPAR